MKLWIVAVIVESALFVSPPLNGQESSVASDKIQKLLSDNWHVRAQAHRELIQERKDMIAQFISAIEEKAQRTNNHGFVEQAMSVLGDIRATEAIDVLVSHIGYPTTAEIDDQSVMNPTMLAFVGTGPATDALIKIGEPCIDPVIMKIRTTDDRVERIACVNVLRRLKTPLVRERIERAVAIASEKEKESLDAALVLYDEWIPTEERRARLQKNLKERFEKDPLPQ